MAFALLTVNTTLSATMEDLWSDPGGTHSFSFASGAEEEFYVRDNDAVFDDYNPDDTSQVVGPDSTIFTPNAVVASRHKFDVTPDNGDPPFTVYVVFEKTTSNNDFAPMNTLNYALVSDTPLIPGVNYAISNQSGDGTVSYSAFSSRILCFGRGTQIETDAGPAAVETLKCGDMVWTIDQGFQPIRWISSTSHRWSPTPDKAKPILIKRGALGAGLPHRDLIVSPQHRMLIPTGDGEVLAPSKALTGLNGVGQMHGCRRMEYFHIMFDRHQVIFAEGTPTESFYPGPYVMQGLSSAQIGQFRAILAAWPRDTGTGTVRGARGFLTVKQAQRLPELRRPVWTRTTLARTVKTARSMSADGTFRPEPKRIGTGLGQGAFSHSMH